MYNEETILKRQVQPHWSDELRFHDRNSNSPACTIYKFIVKKTRNQLSVVIVTAVNQECLKHIEVYDIGIERNIGMSFQLTCPPSDIPVIPSGPNPSLCSQLSRTIHSSTRAPPITNKSVTCSRPENLKKILLRHICITSFDWRL